MAKLTEDQKRDLQEIYFDWKTPWKTVKKLWMKGFYDVPFDVYQGLARHIDKSTDSLLVSKHAWLTMPASIMLRNGSRAAHQISDGEYKHGGTIVGGLSALTGWGAGTYVAHAALAAKLAIFSHGLMWGVSTVAVAAVASPLLVPAFTLGTLVASTAAALTITVLSAAPAAINLHKGFKRTKVVRELAKNGEVLTLADLDQKEIERDALTSKYQYEQYNTVRYGLSRLTDEQRKDVYETLSAEFGKAATPTGTTGTAAAAPVNTLSQPTP